MAFNFKKKNLSLNETAVLLLKDPDTGIELEEEGKPVSITFYGSASPKHRKAVDALMAKSAKRGKREATIEERRQESIDFLVALSVTADNLEDDDGVLIETAEQFKKLYADESLSFVRDQASDFVGASTNFLKRA